MSNYNYRNAICRVCGSSPCFQHCRGCGADIKWRPDALDREIAYAGPKPLNMDETKHDCPAWKEERENRPPWIKIKASIMICPKPLCNLKIKEVPGETEDLASLFQKHVKAHALEIDDNTIDRLRSVINQLRNNNYISYTDPFVGVPESVISIP